MKKKKIEEVNDIPSADKVYGYPIDELITFAQICRKCGIRTEDLHDFCTNAKLIAVKLREEFNKSFENTMNEVMEKEYV